ncbi:hypothetical protein B0A67_22795 [Flavobacterium aquidurense]|uniref:hypothetical protein n=1 Tax=Flavobacterium aquidurense TaxID=362413 RepID=UPI00090F8F63|nr:hypothetical protein [Flavobacterium aquidurense]OXA66818.1 hypothetical protein B0A67_22795 [Flavobacterium aquidurense]SHH67157.1 hypothetical protein SAMN05444481_1235 [Flavobacterium frigidimaris]
MKKTFLLFFVLTQITIYGQTQKLKDTFTITIRNEEGDLNNDGLIDKVLLKMDTINETQPLKLEIYFLQKDKKYKLNVSTEKLMRPQYPNGKYGGDQIPDVLIEEGYLFIGSEIGKNHFWHKFKFNNGYFELHEITNVVWDGKNTTETEFNLLTGKRTEITKPLSSEKILKQTTKKIIVKPLPKINDFRAFDSKLN